MPEDVRLAVPAPALLGPLRPGPDLGGGTGHRRWRRFQTPVADSMRVFTKEICRAVHKYCDFTAGGCGRVDISYCHYVRFICFVKCPFGYPSIYGRLTAPTRRTKWQRAAPAPARTVKAPVVSIPIHLHARANPTLNPSRRAGGHSLIVEKPHRKLGVETQNKGPGSRVAGRGARTRGRPSRRPPASSSRPRTAATRAR